MKDMMLPVGAGSIWGVAKSPSFSTHSGGGGGRDLREIALFVR